MATIAPIPVPSAAYLANCRWIQTHLDELVQQYPDRWIAVDQQRVLAAGSDLGRVTEDASLVTSSLDVVYEFVASVSLIF